MTDRRVEYLPLDEVQRAPRNPKAHDAEGISASIDRYGVAELPLLDERTGRLVAGHGRLDDLQARRTEGQDPPDGVRLAKDGAWLIPVVRGWQSRSDAEAEAYLVASNQLTVNGGWDDEALTQVLADLAEQDADLLAVTGFTEDDLAELLAASTDGGPVPGLTDPDDVPDTPVEAVTRPGDVWLLGEHRLLVGDSTDIAALDGLMQGGLADCVVTDPPYNADYSSRVDKTRRKPWGGIANDNMTPEAFDAFLVDIHSVLWALLKDQGSVYLWTDWKRYPQVARVFGDAFAHKATVVWDKGHFGLGTYYRTQYELQLFGVKGEKVGTWNAGHDERDVWDLARDPVASYAHPTQKPVALAERAISNSSTVGEIVLDLFGGSGSTLIAAHRTRRVARLCELDPKYADTICARYQKHTGDLPILESTGEPHDFLSDLVATPEPANQ